jgi:hypothetical protein
MAQHDAFGAAGGPAGVEDSGEVFALAHRVGRGRGALQQCLIMFGAGGRGVIVRIDQANPRQRLREALANRPERLVDD